MLPIKLSNNLEDGEYFAYPNPQFKRGKEYSHFTTYTLYPIQKLPIFLFVEANLLYMVLDVIQLNSLLSSTMLTFYIKYSLKQNISNKIN
jgi:hypothetical protein